MFGSLKNKWRTKVVVTNPCVKDRTKVSADCMTPMLGAKPKAIIKALEDPQFSNIKASESLGLVTFNIEKRKITLFFNGRLVIRNANDEEDVYKTIKIIEGVIDKAVKK